MFKLQYHLNAFPLCLQRYIARCREKDIERGVGVQESNADRFPSSSSSGRSDSGRTKADGQGATTGGGTDQGQGSDEPTTDERIWRDPSAAEGGAWVGEGYREEGGAESEGGISGVGLGLNTRREVSNRRGARMETKNALAHL